MRRRALLSAGKKESPYAFYFNIELKAGEGWVANAEQLVEINKMFAIMLEYARTVTYRDFEASPETMPPEFDLRVNGERKYWGFYVSSVDANYDLDFYINVISPIGTWFTHTTFYANSGVTSFNLLPM